MYRAQDLQEGDIVLVDGRSALAPLIRWATDAPITHAAMAVAGGLVEALWPRVVASGQDKYQSTGYRYRVVATVAQRTRAAAAIRSRVGLPYGWPELLADGARDILHLPIGARWHPSRYTCSGLVAWAYGLAGVVLTWAPLPSPADLAASPLLVGPRPWLGSDLHAADP